MASRRPHNPETFARELVKLSKMGKTALWRRFEEVFGKKARACNPRTLRVQIARRLASHPAKSECNAPAAPPIREATAATSSGPLVKEYRGERHEVAPVDGGFEYRGQRYRSLSGIARAITGTTWNGPRFFGLTPSAKEVA